MHRILVALMVVVVGCGLAACGKKLDGAYFPRRTPLLINKLEFSGDKVNATYILGVAAKQGTYSIDGNKVNVVIEGQSHVLTIEDDGCLDGGTLIGVLCKP